LCGALKHLIKKPSAEIEELLEFVQGPDFPTGGVITESKQSIINSYKTGKGSFKIRAKWEIEKGSNGAYEIIVTEIPFQVQKSKLIEKIADLINNKKLPMLDDIRDESAEDIRLVLVPKSRNVDPDLLMAMLFKNTDLESRFSMNMNVLDDGITPKVMNLKEILVAFLKHRQNVLIKRSAHRLKNINNRLELLEGYLIAYLNLDEVIHIIRTEDKPKEVLIAKFNLTENQAEAVLNMRLRALRKLEEIEIKKEHTALEEEKLELEALMADEKKQWKVISTEITDINKKFGENSEFGARKSLITDAVEDINVPIEAFIEKENITIYYSKQGWIRAVKGHAKEDAVVKYKEGDEEKFIIHANTTNKIILIAENGRFYTLQANKIPRGKGFGEPIRIMIDVDGDIKISSIMVHEDNAKLLVVTTEGKGFIVNENNVIASTKNGKNVVGVKSGEKLTVCRRINAEDDTIAVVGNNRKLLLFPIDELPEMNKGKGVYLQKYKEAKLSDAKSFKLEDGLTWAIGSRTRTETELLAWQGKRASVGRMAPSGFNKKNRF
jgi:topoisomerase-4 subunit A